MEIRLARTEDIPDILRAVDAARRFMRAHGNKAQWTDGYPDAAQFALDIAKAQCYVCTQNGALHGAFVLAQGRDPTYAYIENGQWLNDLPYGALHRVASDGCLHGVLARAVAFSLDIVKNLRADTHADNTVMRRALEKQGFVHCGTIYLPDGAPRMAYQYVSDNDRP